MVGAAPARGADRRRPRARRSSGCSGCCCATPPATCSGTTRRWRSPSRGTSTPVAVVYDCMDELSAFRGAPADAARSASASCCTRADVVFTGGHSLYEAKRAPAPERPRRSRAASTSAHFAHARARCSATPPDQAAIAAPAPRLLRRDRRAHGPRRCVDGVAAARPDWQLVMLGPVVEDRRRATLPRRPNIHYLGQKAYARAAGATSRGWDVALHALRAQRGDALHQPDQDARVPGRRLPGRLDARSATWCARTASRASCAIADDADGVRRARPRRALARPRRTRAGARASTRMLADACRGTATWARDGGARRRGVPGRAAARGRPRRAGASAATGGGLTMFDYLIVGAGFAGSVLAERLAPAPGSACSSSTSAPTSAATPTTTTTTPALLVHRTGRTSSTPTRREVFDYLSRFTAVAPLRAPRAGQRRRPAACRSRSTSTPSTGSTASTLDLERAARPSSRAVAERARADPHVRGRGRRARSAATSTRSSSAATRASSGASTRPSSTQSVTARVPTRTNRDDRYFTDTYQAMPLHGYTRMFERMLDHPNIKVLLQHRLPRGRRRGAASGT